MWLIAASGPEVSAKRNDDLVNGADASHTQYDDVNQPMKASMLVRAFDE